MNKHHYIIYILNRITKLWFTFSIVFLPFTIYFLVSKKDIPFMGGVLNNPYKNGIPIPAKISIQISADTVVNYKSKDGYRSGGFGLEKNVETRYEMADSVLNDTSLIKKISYNNWVESSTGFSENDNGSIKLTPEKSYWYETTIPISSSGTIKSILLYFYILIQIAIFSLIPFFAIKIFTLVDDKNEFTISLGKNLYKIAFTILLWQVISFIFSFIFSFWYSNLHLETTNVDMPSFTNSVRLSFNPDLYFKFSYVFFALILIVLASIFKHGSKLEQEQALTI